jgi:predicted aspartyl protease
LPDSLLPLVNPAPYRLLVYEYGAGQKLTTPSYWVNVSIDGVEYQAETIFANTDQILLGVELLTEFRLEINFVTGLVLLESVSTP